MLFRNDLISQALHLSTLEIKVRQFRVFLPVTILMFPLVWDCEVFQEKARQRAVSLNTRGTDVVTGCLGSKNENSKKDPKRDMAEEWHDLGQLWGKVLA